MLKELIMNNVKATVAVVGTFAVIGIGTKIIRSRMKNVEVTDEEEVEEVIETEEV